MSAKRCQLCGEPAWGGGKEVAAPGFPPMRVCIDSRHCLERTLGHVDNFLETVREVSQKMLDAAAEVEKRRNAIRLVPPGESDAAS